MSTQLDSLRAFVAARPNSAALRDWSNVLVVAGAKGGIGTSTVAALLASASARRGRETLLVDAAAAGSSLPHLLGTPQDHTDDEPLRIAPRLALATPCAGIGAGNAERTIRYRRATNGFADYDAVIVDAGATLDAVVLAASYAGRLLAVTASDRVSIAAAYALLKVVGHRFSALPLGVLANRCDAAVGAAAWERITAGTDRFLGHAIGLAGTIPADHVLDAAIEAGHALDATTRGVAALAADDVVGRMLVEPDTRRSLSLIRN
jgi:MinD-like ATPase involved in chromosome partitioning or flagellar assembly